MLTGVSIEEIKAFYVCFMLINHGSMG